MRIVLAHSHANTFGGGERAVLEVARALGEAHDVRLMLGGFDPRRTYAELSALPHKRVGRLEWATRLVDADAVITNSFGANLLALRNGAKVIYWVHSTRSIFLRRGQHRLDLVARRALDWLAVRRAAKLAANSRYTAARLRLLYGRDADEVVYPGVDLSQFTPAQSETRRTYAISVGRLSAEKGVDRLLEVWREVPDLPLHIVGDGPADSVRELRARAAGNVVFRGRLTSGDLAQAYRGAAVAVFAPYDEEFGMAPLEAMASGVPVVAWREGGLPETILDGQSGYLVDDAVTFRQRVRLILHDRRRGEALGSAARRRAEEFSWQRTASAMEGLCQQMVGRPAPVPAA